MIYFTPTDQHSAQCIGMRTKYGFLVQWLQSKPGYYSGAALVTEHWEREGT